MLVWRPALLKEGAATALREAARSALDAIAAMADAQLRYVLIDY